MSGGSHSSRHEMGGEVPPYDYVLYIDEAGDLGTKKDQPDSSPWFLLGGVVIAKEYENDLVEWVRSIRHTLHLGAGPELHYKNLSPDKRVAASTLAAKLKMRAFVVASHKQNMRGYENPRAAKREGVNVFYNFCLRVLLERVTFTVAKSSERRFGEQRQLRIVLGETGGIFYSQTRAYIEILRMQALAGSTYLDRMEIQPHVLNFRLVDPVSAKTSAGVQLADLVVSSFNNAVNKAGADPLSATAAEALAPIMARRNGVPAKHGLLLLPWNQQIPDEYKPVFRSYGYWWG